MNILFFFHSRNSRVYHFLSTIVFNQEIRAINQAMLKQILMLNQIMMLNQAMHNNKLHKLMQLNHKQPLHSHNNQTQTTITTTTSTMLLNINQQQQAQESITQVTFCRKRSQHAPILNYSHLTIFVQITGKLQLSRTPDGFSYSFNKV